jgi:hypothetical protein
MCAGRALQYCRCRQGSRKVQMRRRRRMTNGIGRCRLPSSSAQYPSYMGVIRPIAILQMAYDVPGYRIASRRDLRLGNVHCRRTGALGTHAPPPGFSLAQNSFPTSSHCSRQQFTRKHSVHICHIHQNLYVRRYATVVCTQWRSYL